MLRKRFPRCLVAGCFALALAGCVVPGGGSYYQPEVAGGKVQSDANIVAGHKDIATRKFEGLKIETQAREEEKVVHVTVNFEVGSDHVMDADFGLAKIETSADGKGLSLLDVQPMVHMVSGEMDLKANEMVGDDPTGYTLYFDVPRPAPENFVVVLPDLRLDGKQLGPLHISYRRKSGVWLYLISM